MTRATFGAVPGADGTRFRLWAPAHDSISLALPDRDARRPMTPVGDGVFELTCADVGAGDVYAFALPDGMLVPDPASRRQKDDVHGPSVVTDPAAFAWRHGDWRGRPWHETVVYELHTGCFAGGDGFKGVERRLDHLAELGVTALELMPVAAFSGRRGWGYDGVLPYCPAGAYGTLEELLQLVDAAHGRGLMVFLDVVYNHFGPDGNYLGLYAPDFFRKDITTPWGEAIDFRRPEVRRFFIENALYWLDTCRMDGLRLDAVHAIEDESDPHFLVELAREVRSRLKDRHVHLILENEANQASYLDSAAGLYDAQWNDDFHHVLHVLMTGETVGYYADYADGFPEKLRRTLAEGFVFQGETMGYRAGKARGETSRGLPPTAFVSFLHNHDQIGNRAMGERLTRLAPAEIVRAGQALLLLMPQVPMLFMGEEWGTKAPFLFFCDFHDELAEVVRKGRREEFARFPEFADPEKRARIPDPNALSTFEAAALDWREPEKADHAAWLAWTRELLEIRRTEIAPRLDGIAGDQPEACPIAERAVAMSWRLGDGSRLHLVTNLADNAVSGAERPAGDLLFEWPDEATALLAGGRLPAWSVVWCLEAPE